MNLKKKLIKDVVIIVVIFAIIILSATFIFFRFNASLNSLINEAEPALDTIEHMLLDVYQDNVLLLDYLNIQDYETALEYDKEVEKSNTRCKQVENEFENLIITGVISDKDIINQCNSANEIHHDVEDIKNQLLILHKKELATGTDLSAEKQELLKEHSTKFKEAVNEFTNTIDKVSERNKVLRAELLFQSKVYFLSLLILIIIFLVVLIVKIRNFSLTIVKPIDGTINKMSDFVDGKYDTRIKPSKEISEISDLQSNLNNVLNVIENFVAKNPNEKTKIESKLLRKEYLDVIRFLKNNTFEKKKTTISDLKKHLDITHPTVLSRINFLCDKGYIEVSKDGREKFITLTSKAEQF